MTALPATRIDSDDFVTVDIAAELTGLTVRRWQQRAGTLSARGLARLAPPPSGRGKPIWWVSRSVDRRLAACPARAVREDHARRALCESYPVEHVERAYRKSHWLREWRTRCGFPRRADVTEVSIAQEIVAEAVRIEQPGFRISVRTLQAWWKAYNSVVDGRIRGVESLVDKYASSQSSAMSSADDEPTDVLQTGGCPSNRATARSPEASEFFFSLYHTQARHSIKTCHAATLQKSSAEGWDWPASYASTARWVREYSNRELDCLHREGTGSHSHRYMQHLDVDRTTLRVAELYELDHSQADFWCRHQGRPIRPWLSAIMDSRSRVLVGWHLGASPHQDAILASMRMAFSEWAVPDGIHIDRGKDFTSELLTGVTKREARRLRSELGPDWRDQVKHQADVFWLGVVGELGIAITEAIPYHPWAKGMVERWFGQMHDKMDRTQFTYCGPSPDKRPECTEELRHADDLPTLDELRSEFADFVLLYHSDPHRGLDGATPLDVWRTATSLRVAEDSALTPLLQARGVYRVGPNGVSFRIAGTTLGFGATSTRLRAYAGRDVFITLDPAACDSCVAYTAARGARRFIDRLACNVPIPANCSVDDLREAIATIRRRNKHIDRARREAPHRMRNAGREIAAQRQQRAAELRATGTDDHRAHAATYRPVHTGFEAVSTPVRVDVIDAQFDDGDMADLCGHSAPVVVCRDDDCDLSDLLSGESLAVCPDADEDGLDALL